MAEGLSERITRLETELRARLARVESARPNIQDWVDRLNLRVNRFLAGQAVTVDVTGNPGFDPICAWIQCARTEEPQHIRALLGVLAIAKAEEGCMSYRRIEKAAVIVASIEAEVFPPEKGGGA